MPEKRVVSDGSKSNEDCESIEIECLTLSQVIAAADNYDKIVVKLDVEGAEYEILEDLIRTGAISKISKIYIEWHWDRIGMNFEEHKNFTQKVNPLCELLDWDALDFEIHRKKDQMAAKSRHDFIDGVF